jgi:hypothetical protein
MAVAAPDPAGPAMPSGRRTRPPAGPPSAGSGLGHTRRAGRAPCRWAGPARPARLRTHPGRVARTRCAHRPGARSRRRLGRLRHRRSAPARRRPRARLDRSRWPYPRRGVRSSTVRPAPGTAGGSQPALQAVSSTSPRRAPARPQPARSGPAAGSVRPGSDQNTPKRQHDATPGQDGRWSRGVAGPAEACGRSCSPSTGARPRTKGPFPHVR